MKLSFNEMMEIHLPSKLIFMYDIPDSFTESAISHSITEKCPLSGMKVAVFVECGKIPHFHIFKNIGENQNKRIAGKRTKNKDTFHTCVCFMDNRYFHHPGKTDIFNGKECKALVEILNKKYKDVYDGKITLYQALCRSWNDSVDTSCNGNAPYIPNKIIKNMPDYSYIKPYKTDKEVKEEYEELMNLQNMII